MALPNAEPSLRGRQNSRRERQLSSAADLCRPDPHQCRDRDEEQDQVHRHQQGLGDRAHVGRPVSRARRPAWPARGRVRCHGGSTGLRAPIGPILTTKGGLAYVARARGRRERSQWRDRAGFAPASAIRRSFMGIRLVLCCCSVLQFRVDSARLAAAKRGQHNGGRRGNQGAAARASGRTTARRAGAWCRARVVRESRAQPNQRWLRAQRSNSPGHEAGSLSGVPSAQPWPPVW